jgi:serine/threonine-protein kinase
MQDASDSTPLEDARDEVDPGRGFDQGEDPQEERAPSVIERIGELTGSKPRILLRDDSAGHAPLLEPPGPKERVAAGKYVVQGELGRGGVGSVHRGHDQDLGRDVALKFLHEKYRSQPAVLQRFVEEAQIGGQLQHPGIVPVYDLGLVDGKPFFAMKLVKGETLARKLAQRSSPGEDLHSFLAIFEDVCQTLAYAHARGVVHRDLKPANIMIGSFGEVQVVDWGMGKVLQQGGVADERPAAERPADASVIETVRSGAQGTKSLVGSVMGTPAYMPPEQARGDVEAMDERSDVFALGAILCEILTGWPPYVGDLEQVIGMAAMARLEDAHERLASCVAEAQMVELATRCLMPAPAARPRSAEVVARAVHEHLAAVEARVHAARVEVAEAKVRAAAQKRTQTLGIGLTVVIAAGLFTCRG